MALFSLLMAILAERLKLLPESWQFDSLQTWLHQRLFGGDDFYSGKVSEFKVLAALLLPALLVYLAISLVEGMVWGLVSLAVWVLVAMVCFSHQEQRSAFKRYIQAACRGDIQACYRHAAELDCSSCLEAVSADELGLKVGQSVAWINYRFYGAVALYLIVLGPVAAVLYCTVRFYDVRQKAQQQTTAEFKLPYVDAILTVLDWLPSRLFAFGYVLTGHFHSAFSRWQKLAFNASSSARQIITETATEAETIPAPSAAPVCLQPTLVLLGLSKRNFVLLLALASLLTIFGFIS
ncbi:beta-lactamase regulator AmpE [Shewanella khirikhana]|uniref:Regulatory protein AmpE n=1 Tax=Shewanella khirikhana TaxID=1965282 RepID=A0ABM7DX80_9GAMM|nr:beta-lactamase regulator AmpE [Shewanella khirikhana]AZQ13097.1 regulatory protein AmpE [Shewanella khirikhana]